jgi:hypothetical protein
MKKGMIFSLGFSLFLISMSCQLSSDYDSSHNENFQGVWESEDGKQIKFEDESIFLNFLDASDLSWENDETILYISNESETKEYNYRYDYSDKVLYIFSEVFYPSENDFAMLSSDQYITDIFDSYVNPLDTFIEQIVTLTLEEADPAEISVATIDGDSVIMDEYIEHVCTITTTSYYDGMDPVSSTISSTWLTYHPDTDFGNGSVVPTFTYETSEDEITLDAVEFGPVNLVGTWSEDGSTTDFTVSTDGTIDGDLDGYFIDWDGSDYIFSDGLGSDLSLSYDTSNDELTADGTVYQKI